MLFVVSNVLRITEWNSGPNWLTCWWFRKFRLVTVLLHKIPDRLRWDVNIDPYLLRKIELESIWCSSIDLKTLNAYIIDKNVRLNDIASLNKFEQLFKRALTCQYRLLNLLQVLFIRDVICFCCVSYVCLYTQQCIYVICFCVYLSCS